MPHDAPSHWHEPKAGEVAGLGKFKRPAMPYDQFMESEGIPCYRSIGVRTVEKSSKRHACRRNASSTHSVNFEMKRATLARVKSRSSAGPAVISGQPVTKVPLCSFLMLSRQLMRYVMCFCGMSSFMLLLSSVMVLSRNSPSSCKMRARGTLRRSGAVECSARPSSHARERSCGRGDTLPHITFVPLSDAIFSNLTPAMSAAAAAAAETPFPDMAAP